MMDGHCFSNVNGSFNKTGSKIIAFYDRIFFQNLFASHLFSAEMFSS